MDESLIGTQFGGYEIVAQIGKGGMATVFRAHQPRMDRDVAIKIIHHLQTNQLGRERFQREARLIARLEHAHILPVYDYDGNHSPPYIVMRYLPGGTLKDVLKQGIGQSIPPLPYNDSIHLLRQVASALDYAHRQGIIHRDIKPSNILIDNQGNAFLADFGIARQEAGDKENQLTATGVMIGTPAYMAPEQGQGIASTASDIYAMGIICFELLTGTAPFGSGSNLSVILSHMQAPIPSAVALNSGLPPMVDAVLMTALAKEPQNRHPTARALVEELAEALKLARMNVPTQLVTAVQTTVAPTEPFPTDSQGTPTEQQKQVTAVYLDLNELTEHLYLTQDTEHVHRLTDTIWEQCYEIVQEHGGVPQPRASDAVVMLWGAGITAENDPEQAIRATLKMRTAVAKLLAETELEEDDEGEPLPFRATITTGQVLLTYDSSGGTETASASGPSLTLARRLNRSTPPGEILIGDSTQQLVRGLFDLKTLPPKKLRGRKNPIDIFLVQRIKPRSFHVETRGIEGIQTKMVGRDRELQQLQDAFSLALEDEETQAISIFGDAGIGKSRLLYEFSQWVDECEEDIYQFRARATPQFLHTPYALARDMFADLFDILDNDPLPTVRQKFSEGMRQLIGASAAEKAPFIGHLVGYDFSDEPALESILSSAQQFTTQALRYTNEFFTAVIVAKPTLIQLEDIHWADDKSLDLFNSLVHEDEERPLLLCCASRPDLLDRRPNWGSGQEFHTHINLAALSKLNSRRLVKEVLKQVENIPKELRDLIVNRAEGNPYYVEELIKVLIHDQVIIKSETSDAWEVDLTRLAKVRVPTTLTGILQARIDTLPVPQRNLLQRAAIIGRVFWDKAVAHLSEADGAATQTVSLLLDTLVEREMIVLREETSFTGSQEYVFRHNIMRDVVYETILPSQRALYHKQVAEWIILYSGERVHEHAELIADHFKLAEEANEAAHYLCTAAERAEQAGAISDAQHLWQTALELLDENDLERLPIQIALGSMLYYQGNYREAETLLQTVLEIAESQQKTSQVVSSLNILSRIATQHGDYAKAKTLLEKNIQLAAKDPDLQANMSITLYELGWVEVSLGNFSEANRALLESRNIAEKKGNKRGQAHAFNGLGILALIQDDFKMADTHLKQGLAIYETLGDQLNSAVLQGNLGENARRQGDLTTAQTYFEAALAIHKQIGNQWDTAVTLGNMGHVAAAQENDTLALKHYYEALEIAMQLEALGTVLEVIAGLTLPLFRQGEDEEAVALLGMVLHHAALSTDGRDIAMPIMEQFQRDLPSELVTTALERGKAFDLNTAVVNILQNNS